MNVRDNPLIFTGCAMQRTKAHPSGSTHPPTKQKSEARKQKSDLMICELWQNGTNSVHDMCVVNTDNKYHLAKTPDKCLQEAERAKKKMYLEAFLQQC